MKQITVYYSIRNGGDGSAFLRWFLTGEAARKDQNDMEAGWGETCIGSVETFEQSDIHQEALAGYDEYDEED